jgi:hypothetical protein
MSNVQSIWSVPVLADFGLPNALLPYNIYPNTLRCLSLRTCGMRTPCREDPGSTPRDQRSESRVQTFDRVEKWKGEISPWILHKKWMDPDPKIPLPSPLHLPYLRLCWFYNQQSIKIDMIKSSYSLDTTDMHIIHLCKRRLQRRHAILNACFNLTHHRTTEKRYGNDQWLMGPSVLHDSSISIFIQG